jgi:hypothetical protein
VQRLRGQGTAPAPRALDEGFQPLHAIPVQDDQLLRGHRLGRAYRPRIRGRIRAHPVQEILRDRCSGPDTTCPGPGPAQAGPAATPAQHTTAAASITGHRPRRTPAATDPRTAAASPIKRPGIPQPASEDLTGNRTRQSSPGTSAYVCANFDAQQPATARLMLTGRAGGPQLVAGQPRSVRK